MTRTNHPGRPEPGAGITVQRATRAARLPRGADLPAWVRAAAGSAAGAVTLRLTGWAESRRLNRRWRGKDRSTNVLAFPAGVSGELGDLIICLPLVHREAREQGKTALAHLAHLVVHGTLHLLGHDHDNPGPARKMEALETRLLRRLGFPDPYQPATPVPARPLRARRRTA
ncbi:MAG: rRNA maturation RNase YbeY [Gammaproteobacteria bacterium]|nr:rRNA maturation RNase YbeY [Gammaproteobacteria bacterium]